MKLDCRNFRAALELALAGEGRALSTLAWHEHLAGCGECRTLLEAEEALELLLASLPDPRLPRRLTERVLVRLRAARRAEVQLDALLALDHPAEAPSGLAARVLAGLALERERAASADSDAEREDVSLERLLDDAGHVEREHDLAPRVLARLRAAEAEQDRRLEIVLDRAEELAPSRAPSGLAERLLAGLVAERANAAQTEDVHARPAPEPLVSADARPRVLGSFVRRRFVWALAASLVLALAVWGVSLVGGARDDAPIVQPPERGPRAPADDANGGAAPTEPNAPSSEMLAALEVLEQWDLLMTDDVDVLLSTFAPADQALFDLQAFDEGAVPVDESGGDGTKSAPKPNAKKSEEQKG